MDGIWGRKTCFSRNNKKKIKENFYLSRIYKIRDKV